MGKNYRLAVAFTSYALAGTALALPVVGYDADITLTSAPIVLEGTALNVAVVGKNADPQLAFLVPAGTVVQISTNTRADVNPADDPDANPDYPAAAPWEQNYGWGSNNLSEYSGAVFADDIGTFGTLMTWAAPGHSTDCEATCWLGFDVAEQQWKIVGKKPLPVPVVTSYSAGTTPPSSDFNHTYGDWIGSSASWGAFAQSGYNPPLGGHTRNSFAYVPGSAAGNTGGKIVVAWHPTGNTSSTSIAGAWVWDADTGLFERTANARPDFGSACTGVAYHAATGVVIGHNSVSSHTGSEIDYLDLSTMSWTRRNATASVDINLDATNFTFGDLFVMVTNGSGSPPMTFKAAPISTIKAGGSWSWTTLTVSATSWPTTGSGDTYNVHWEYCPNDGCFYAVNRQSGSHTIWKLTPPSSAGDTAGLLSGTWNVTSETLSGDAILAADWDYSRLRWAQSINAFLWYGDDVSAAVQAIRPSGA